MKKVSELEKIFEFEKYKFQFSFNLTRIGLYKVRLFKNGEPIETPNTLYKFYGKSSYSLDSLKGGYLYFSDPKKFNDPFDCLSNRERYIIRGGKEITNHRNNIGVCCFSIINNNPLMWGHYTNNYTGFCVKYDNYNLLKSPKVAIKRHVSYFKNYEAGNSNLSSTIKEIENTNLEADKKNILQSIIKMAFEYCWKYIDWKYEKEYRAISINALEFDRKLKFDKKNIKEIYIGHKLKDTDTEYYNKLIEIIKTNYRDCEVFVVEPDPLKVKLDFQLLNKPWPYAKQNTKYKSRFLFNFYKILNILINHDKHKTF